MEDPVRMGLSYTTHFTSLLFKPLVNVSQRRITRNVGIDKVSTKNIVGNSALDRKIDVLLRFGVIISKGMFVDVSKKKD